MMKISLRRRINQEGAETKLLVRAENKIEAKQLYVMAVK